MFALVRSDRHRGISPRDRSLRACLVLCFFALALVSAPWHRCFAELDEPLDFTVPNEAAKAAFEEANSLLSEAAKQIGSIQNPQDMTETDIKALAEAWVLMANAKGQYMITEAHLKETKVKASRALKEVKSIMKKRSKEEAPEAKDMLESFLGQTDERIKATHFQIEKIDAMLKKADKSIKSG